MNERDIDKLQRVLDYQLHLDDGDQRAETERLLAQDGEARKLKESLEGILKPLGSLEAEPVPEGLAARTGEYIAQHDQARVMAQASAAIAGRRGGREYKKKVKGSRIVWVLSNLRDAVAVAACLGLLFLALRPGFRQARQVSQRQLCASQLGLVGSALGQYAADNSGLMPYVKHQPGAKWWHVGEQDNNKYSNTQNFFLLVKDGYVGPGAFVCPGAPRKTIRFRIKVKDLNSETLRAMRDFANRQLVNYSFRLQFDNRNSRLLRIGDSVIMSDQNPLFADFDTAQHDELDLSDKGYLLQSNSPNHGNRGQNVLYGGGEVSFADDRHVGPALDDIFTIQSAIRYRGNERPASERDVFIAP